MNPQDRLLDTPRIVYPAPITPPQVRKGQGWCGVLPFAYTWAVVVNLSPDHYERRYCYEHQEDAIEGLASWPGEGHPSGPWIKCKGAGIDLLNPEIGNPRPSNRPRGA